MADRRDAALAERAVAEPAAEAALGRKRLHGFASWWPAQLAAGMLG
jgi:hypothetical protein